MNPHPTVAGFRSDSGQLVVGGWPIDRLAARVGSTPFFAYDRRAVTERVQSLRDALPLGVHLSYAVKANPMPALVQHVSQLVDGLDVASAGEMRVALDTPTDPEMVSFAGPGKSDGELAQAVAAGVMVELESMTEARRVVAAAERLGVRPRVAIRINPDFRVKGSGMRMGGGPQQFGIDTERVPDVLSYLGSADVDFRGFHVFTGSQNLNADILIEAQSRTVELAIHLAEAAPAPVRYLNLGGGFGIPYFESDAPLDVSAIGRHLAQLIDTLVAPSLPEATIAIELGRYIVGEAGVYVTRVVDRKVSRGQTFLVVDGGLHHQLAASGNFGQVIRRNFPIASCTETRLDPVAGDKEEVSVVGCLCTPLDLLGDKVMLGRADVGDLIVIFQAGAYGRTASPTSFLSHPEAHEVLV